MRSRPPGRTRTARTVVIGIGLLTVALLPAPAASAAPAQAVTVSPEHPVYVAAEGDRVVVAVTASTSDGAPLAGPATVRYTAPAPDLATASGALTFPAGAASGATQRFTVDVRRDGAAETAETIPLTLSPESTRTAVGRQPVVLVDAHGLAYLDARLPADRRVADLLARMTLEEKIGQMTQAERGAVADDPTLIARWRLGSVLSGGGSTPPTNTPAAWVAMVNDFQAQALRTRLQIPLLYGIDAVHGHGNAHGATVFPHNIGLGATRDPALVERVGHATAAETRATGIPWSFSPCVCVARDDRWGRTYESFGEDPALVVSMESIIPGLQGRRPSRLDDSDRVLATAKHYAGDGDTEFDTATAQANVGRPWYERRYTIDQGVTVTSRRDFDRIDLAPYRRAVQRGVGAVMPSFSSVDFTEDGVGNPVKMHARRDLVTGVLKGRIGFTGFVVSDWEGIHQIPDPAEPTNTGLTAYKVRVGVNAGIDMFMEPFSAKPFQDLLLTEVTAGRVGLARIDDAVRRILRKKVQLGLFERPFASPDNVHRVGAPAHRAIARRAAAESQVLLKNAGTVLPLRRDAAVYVAGRNADNIGNQAGGWTIAWQGLSGDVVPGTTVLDGIREVAPRARVTYSPDASAPTAGADVGVVVVGETPYAEGYGDVGGPFCGFCPEALHEEKSLELQPVDRAVVEKVCAAIARCVVLVVSGRPQVVTDQLGRIDALVASWLPGSEGAGVADVLFGRRPFTGRLPVTWPRTAAQEPINVGDRDYRPLYPFGWGLRTDAARARLQGAVAGLADDRGDRAVRGALRQLRPALARANWHGDGSVRREDPVLDRLGAALTLLERSRSDTSAAADVIVSVARDVAQAAAAAGRAPARWARLVADADQALLTGHRTTAYALLVRAAG